MQTSNNVIDIGDSLYCLYDISCLICRDLHLVEVFKVKICLTVLASEALS